MDTDTLAIILGIIIAVPIWRLYHKFFVVFYRDVFWGVLGEIFGAIFTGYVISKVIFWLFGGIISAILKIVVFVALIALAALVIAFVAWTISFLLFLHRKKLHPFKKGTIPSLEEKPVRESYTSTLLFSYWSASYAIHHNRIFYAIIIAVPIIGIVAIIAISFGGT